MLPNKRFKRTSTPLCFVPKGCCVRDDIAIRYAAPGTTNYGRKILCDNYEREKG